MDNRWPFFTVDLELTNQCELNCAFCPRDSIARPFGFMSQQTFETIIDQLAEIPSRIAFCGMGNPLLHPRLVEFGQHCRGKSVNWGIVCNAAALNQQNISRLCQISPGFIEISFPSIDRSEFVHILPDYAFDSALENINQLVTSRGSTRGLCVVGVKSSVSTQSSQTFAAFWADRGLNSRLSQCHSRGGNMNDPELLSAEPSKIETCGLFAAHSFITWQGKLLACCHDLKGETEIADFAAVSVKHAADHKLSILAAGMPWPICHCCDEPAASRPLPPDLFPSSRKARSKYLAKAGQALPASH